MENLWSRIFLGQFSFHDSVVGESQLDASRGTQKTPEYRASRWQIPLRKSLNASPTCGQSVGTRIPPTPPSVQNEVVVPAQIKGAVLD